LQNDFSELFQTIVTDVDFLVGPETFATHGLELATVEAKLDHFLFFLLVVGRGLAVVFLFFLVVFFWLKNSQAGSHGCTDLSRPSACWVLLSLHFIPRPRATAQIIAAQL